jgi:hypothetical protein
MGYGRREWRERAPAAPRERIIRVTLSTMQSVSGIGDVVAPGTAYFYGEYQGDGVLVAFSKELDGEEGKEQETGRLLAVMYDCGAMTGQPLGDGLVMEPGVPVLQGLLPAGLAPMQSPQASQWSGGGWTLSITGTGGVLERKVEG